MKSNNFEKKKVKSYSTNLRLRLKIKILVPSNQTSCIMYYVL